jgi:hypothetical protein
MAGRVSLPFRGGIVRTSEGVKAVDEVRVPATLRRGPPLRPLTEDQQPTPPPGIPQFCMVCRMRFYARRRRPVCGLRCRREL